MKLDYPLNVLNYKLSFTKNDYNSIQPALHKIQNSLNEISTIENGADNKY